MNMEELCARCCKLYTPAVSDVLDKMGYWHHNMSAGLIPLQPGKKFAGPAFTLLGTASSEMDKTKRLAPQALDHFYPHCVPVMSTGGDMQTGHWGELMTNACLLHGCNGAVVDGGLRDTSAIDALGFPVLYRFTSPGDALGRFNVVAYECPIECAGVVVNPGDFIFADRDGVTVVPKELTEEVLLEAESVVSVENEIRGRILRGESFAELYVQYEQF